MCSKNSFESPDSDWISSRLCSQRDVSRCASAKSSSPPALRSEEHTSELQSHSDLVCRLLLEKKKTRLNSSHTVISYAVFCLKKKILRPQSTLSLDLRTTQRIQRFSCAFEKVRNRDNTDLND